MRYVMLVYQNEDAAREASEEALAASLERFNAFHAEVAASGNLVDGTRLRHSDTATTVRAPNGTPLTTDGPYAETKEQLGGFYLMECADLDEAIAIAARCPAAESGHIEVRPVFEAEGQ